MTGRLRYTLEPSITLAMLAHTFLAEIAAAEIGREPKNGASGLAPLAVAETWRLLDVAHFGYTHHRIRRDHPLSWSSGGDASSHRTLLPLPAPNPPHPGEAQTTDFTTDRRPSKGSQRINVLLRVIQLVGLVWAYPMRFVVNSP